MTAQWKRLPLGHVITLQRGFDLPSSDRKPGIVPVVSSSGVTGSHDESRVAAPGVVTGRYGTLGQVFYVEEDFWPLNTTLWVRDFKGNDPRFISYLLKTLDFQAVNDKSSVPGINRNHLHEIEVTIPALDEQRRIAHILGTLDDKIELNRQMNQTLDEIARTLFRSWFVDFDPVRAKMEGRQPDGMDAETAALFPDRLVDSELGAIPEGWEILPLRDVATLNKQAIKPSDYLDEIFDHYSLPSFDKGMTPTFDFGGQIASNKTVVVPNSVLLSKLNPHIPRIWLPNVSSERRSVSSTEFMVLTPNDQISRGYLFQSLKSTPFQERFRSRVTGTTGSHQRVSPESLLSIPLVVPTRQTVDVYECIVSPMHSMVHLQLENSLALSELRDALLPLLLCGKVRNDKPDYIGTQ